MKKSKYEYLNLPFRFGKASYPKVQIVDLIEENEESGKISTVISGLLLDKIEQKLKMILDILISLVTLIL